MGFTDLFIRRPVLAAVVSLLILLIGAVAGFSLPIRQYPKLENTVITITTLYPGAAPELIQGFITTPIEQAVATAEGLDYVTSNSIQGVSTIQAYVRLNYDPSKAMTDVMAKVQQVKFLIPPEAQDPVIIKQTGQTVDIMYIGFSSATVSNAAIADYLARVVQPLMATIDGVAQAEILGGQSFAMRIWLDPLRMAARGISADDVALAIRANNFQAAPGQRKGYFTVTDVIADTGLTGADQFKEMVVKARNGALIRLKDIATVELGPQNTNTAVSMNGDHAVFLGIQVTPTGNPLSVVKDIRAMQGEIERTLPPGVGMKIAYDGTVFIQSSIDEVVRTLVEAAVIVIIVIFLFLGSLRSVVIPIVTIPLSLVGILSVMLALGFSLNLLTLLAMVLAIGLVVDDAIVVVENVHRHMEEGRTPLQSALIGAREIVGPIIAMTITLAAVYAPIGLLGGITGALFREFAFSLAGSVIVSGVIALTLSPMMCASLLKREALQGGFSGVIERGFAAIAERYARLLAKALAFRPVVYVFALAILAAIAFLFLNTKAELAPEEDQGVLLGLSKAPQYANLDYMEAYSQQLNAAYAFFPETDRTFIISGTQGPQQGFSGFVLEPWNQRGRSTLTLKPLVQQAVSRIDGINTFIFSPSPLPTSVQGLPFQMVIDAPADYETIYNAMEKLKQAARQSGLFIVTDSDLRFDNPVIHVHIDRSKANDLGVTMQGVADTLAVLVGENFINRFDLSGRSYYVIPQVPRADRLTPASLANYYVTTASGQQIPLSTVVSLDEGTEPNALTQYNQLNSATFQAVLVPGVTMGQAVDFFEQAAKSLPQGFSHDYFGDARQYTREGNKLTYTFVFALMIIYLVLAAQFESLRDPVVILVSVPMSVFGALLPLFFWVASLNIYTQIGLVTLIGLISKHGILMVSFANELQRQESLGRVEAIARAARVRLRPILMTTAAMVVGLLPLLVATGAGAASRFSIGLVVVSGMSIGTLFTLFVLPAVYCVLGSDHRPAVSAAREAEIAAVS
ncbi:MAG TPA: efflux RND transporter permease subunit [Stellaceae bacterium]|nr:efflux RND transporter permease subunit [Stellaceae bacterium]